jgi:hypothetical protein
MGSAAVKHPVASGASRQVEIRVRFEPGLGAALYASLKDGEVAPMTVARNLGRGRTLLQFHGFTLMAHGAPEWTPGETFKVYVKELGPPLVLAPVEWKGKSDKDRQRVAMVDTAVVPGFVGGAGQDARR